MTLDPPPPPNVTMMLRYNSAISVSALHTARKWQLVNHPWSMDRLVQWARLVWLVHGVASWCGYTVCPVLELVSRALGLVWGYPYKAMYILCTYLSLFQAYVIRDTVNTVKLALSGLSKSGRWSPKRSKYMVWDRTKWSLNRDTGGHKDKFLKHASSTLN
jgi:hypothetical protein